jgi:TPR repeat protein
MSVAVYIRTAIAALVVGAMPMLASAQSEAAKALVEKGYASLSAGDKIAMTEYFAQSCETDPAFGQCVAAGDNLAAGYGGVIVDIPRAARLYELGCNAGINRGCTKAAELKAKNGTAEDAAAAVALFKKTCETDWTADKECLKLAAAYATGKGIAQNLAEAARLYEETCHIANQYRLPNPEACLLSGQAYLNGTGVTADRAKATQRIRIACQYEREGACDLLATLEPPAPKQVAAAPGSPAPTPAKPRTDQKARYTAAVEALRSTDADIASKGATEVFSLCRNENYGEACYFYANALMQSEKVSDHVDAIPFYEQGCDSGYADACVSAANYLAGVEGFPKDVVKAARLLDRGCLELDAVTCYASGTFYRDGYLGKADPAKAKVHLSRACDNGDPVACEEAAALGAEVKPAARYTVPDAVTLAAFEKRYNEATSRANASDAATRNQGFDELMDLCDAFYGKACYWLGDALMLAKDAKSRADAYAYFSVGCEGRFASACTRAALMLEEGKDIQKNLNVAAAFRDEACKYNDKTGCFASGNAFAQGLTGSPDYAKARKYLTTSCAQGEPAACKDLGVMQENGLGGPPDQMAALANYRLACKANEASGCYNVAVADYNAWPGTSATNQQKIEGFLNACELGSAPACDVAAKLTSTGLGLSLYPGRSERSRSLACTLDKQYCQ